MGEIALLVVVGILLVDRTSAPRLVIRDDHDKLPTRDLFDTRTAQ